MTSIRGYSQVPKLTVEHLMAERHARASRIMSEDFYKRWFKGHWTSQDNATAVTQGWHIWRDNSDAPWTIRYLNTKGEHKFKRAVAMNRRLACRALRIVTISALGGKLEPLED